MSKTDNGKFFIVVFQRFVKLKKSARGTTAPMAQTTGLNDFADITVKEMMQVEAI